MAKLWPSRSVLARIQSVAWYSCCSTHPVHQMISHIMAIGKSFGMQRTEAFNELTPYGTMSKMKRDREQREDLCDRGLYRACQIGDVKMATVWLTRGANMNRQNYDAQDRTPLHVSVIGMPELVHPGSSPALRQHGTAYRVGKIAVVQASRSSCSR